MIDLLVFLGGLGLLLGGGEALVRGASALAVRMGVAPVVIGMTVVAFGTSMPELSVSVIAARAGNSDIALGNVVGSNIANIGLLLGITALFRPMRVHRSLVTREIPMMVLASAAGAVLAFDGFFDGFSGGGPDRIGRGDGVVLLLLFAVFLYYTAADALRQRAGDPFASEAASREQARAHPSAGLSAVLILGGIVGVVAGGDILLRGAIGMGRALGVSESVIGLTAVAVGTSLPELATSLVAARRGQSDLAVGNIVGSNIFNLLFIAGTSATISSMTLHAHGRLDMLVMGAFALALLPLAVSGGMRLNRLEGLLLLLGYAWYVTALARRG